MPKTCITFASPIGSSKSPIANYLSYKLNIPVFNNDSIRTEVQEDLLRVDQEEFQKRKNSRLRELVDSGVSFINDSSLDRNWPEFKKNLEERGYKIFLISLDFSKEFLIRIWEAKGYTEFDALDRTFEQHQEFLRKHNEDVNIHLEDKDFKNRLNIVFEKCRSWIDYF